MSWTDDRVELLKKLWTEGLSASQIAGRLGGVSRNAVIGKVHRLGLAGRVNTPRNKPMRPRARIGAIKRVAKPRISQSGNPALRALYQPDGDRYVPPPEELDIPPSERVALVELTECGCRWPIGDPQTAEFGFCNRKKVPGLPYCEVHARHAFQPPQSRSKRDRIEQQPATEAPALSAEPAKDAKETVDA
ncbi:MAG: GcrA family cell cycle regulator [Pseudomonadota bacterium]